MTQKHKLENSAIEDGAVSRVTHSSFMSTSSDQNSSDAQYVKNKILEASERVSEESRVYLTARAEDGGKINIVENEYPYKISIKSPSLTV